jgi:hypothetical protein
MLAAKVDAGASRAITQFFFENDLYFAYLDRVRSRGIDVPIVPGILPVQNFTQTKNFAARCGASIPAWLAKRFEGLDHDAATRKLIAAAVAAEQVLDLFDRGVTDFHFYTMNRADLVYAICHLLGLRPSSTEPAPTRRADEKRDHQRLPVKAPRSAAEQHEGMDPGDSESGRGVCGEEHVQRLPRRRPRTQHNQLLVEARA